MSPQWLEAKEAIDLVEEAVKLVSDAVIRARAGIKDPRRPIGSPHLLEGITDEGEIEEEARHRVMSELRHHFRPEFLNRVDDIVLFKPLTLEEVKKIVGLLAKDLERRLKDRDIRLEIGDAAKEFVAKTGYDPVYGARPLKRFLQRELETRIGRALIGGGVQDGSTVKVDLQGDELSVSYVNLEKGER